jgi:hypothetical protein
MSLAKKLGIALVVILIILAAAFWVLTRGDTASVPWEEVVGTDPTLEEPNAEGIPTVAIAEPVGWADDEVPIAAEGLAVTRFADGLEHPRTLQALPNGDILVSLTRAPAKEDDGGIMAWIAGLLMDRAGAGGESPNQVVLLRDADGDGRAEVRQVLLDGLDSPSGLAWHDGTLYVANHDEVLAYPYELGAAAVSGEPRKVTDLAALVKAGRNRPAAIRALRGVPVKNWPPNEIGPLVDNLVGYLSGMPARFRTQPPATDAIALARGLSSRLTPARAKALELRLGNLNVRVIAIGTVPACGHEQFVFRPALPGIVFAGRPHTPQVAFLDSVEVA